MAGSSPINKYKQARSHPEKRDFLRKWEIDKTFAWLEAEEKAYKASEEAIARACAWCHLWDVARLNGVSYQPGCKKQDEWLRGLVSGCEEKVSDDPYWRDKGEQVWWYSKDFEKITTTKRGRGMEIRGGAAIKDKAEWDQIQNAMMTDDADVSGAAMEKPLKKQKTTDAPGENTEA